MAFLKIELKQIQSNQLVILNHLVFIVTIGRSALGFWGTFSLPVNQLNYCPLPIDKIIDLQNFEDKIAGDNEFRTWVVIFIICSN